jgi:hypothetical protein
MVSRRLSAQWWRLQVVQVQQVPPQSHLSTSIYPRVDLLLHLFVAPHQAAFAVDSHQALACLPLAWHLLQQLPWPLATLMLTSLRMAALFLTQPRMELLGPGGPMAVHTLQPGLC